jgi:hypothetical protein
LGQASDGFSYAFLDGFYTCDERRADRSQANKYYSKFAFGWRDASSFACHRDFSFELKMLAEHRNRERVVCPWKSC